VKRFTSINNSPKRKIAMCEIKVRTISPDR
jgi:hypothetical protein